MSRRRVVNTDDVHGPDVLVFGSAVSECVEPKELLDSMTFALETLVHNREIIAYMLDGAEQQLHGRTDALVVRAELGRSVKSIW